MVEGWAVIIEKKMSMLPTPSVGKKRWTRELVLFILSSASGFSNLEPAARLRL